jgi:cell pole-organizing protein PopZ
MNQMDAGDELSMEDILASIRQIIAEEPKSAAPPPPPTLAVPQPQPSQLQAPQPAVQVTTVGLPQGYAIPRPDPSAGRSSSDAPGIPLPSFPDQRLRAPAPAPLSPRIVEAAAQQSSPAKAQSTVAMGGGEPRLDSAANGTLAARLNDVFGQGPALRQPGNGRPAPNYGAQTVKSALDADLADLMDDEGPSVQAAPTPVSVSPVAPQVAAATAHQPVVAPRITPPSAAPVVAAQERPSLFAQPIASAPPPVATLPVVTPSPAMTPPPVAMPPTEVAAIPRSSVMATPHPLPSWLNSAPKPAGDVAAAAQVAPVAPVVVAPAVVAPVSAPQQPLVPDALATPHPEAVSPPKVKAAPVVIAAMAAPAKRAPAITVSLSNPAAFAPAVTVAPAVAPVAPPEAVVPVLPVPPVTPTTPLSMADVLPAPDVAMAWVPSARAAPVVEPQPLSIETAAPALAAEATLVAASPALPSAADDAPQVDAAVASALGALAAGLAASRGTVKPEIVVAATPAPSPAVEALAPVAVQQELPPQAVTPPQTTSQAVATQDAHSEGVALEPVYPHDDTAVELLRPMLRHWLDSNMPRIVEKALRAELAANPPGSKPDSDG